MLLIKNLVSWLAPANCLRCGAEGEAICAVCLPHIPHRKTPTCFSCNALTIDGSACPRCRRRTRLSGVSVASHYDGLVKDLVIKLKFNGDQSVANLLAKLVTPLPRLCSAGDFDLVTWVPPAPKRYRQRGFHPAELIAKSVAKDLRVPYQPLLGRLGNQRQVGHNRQDRLEQIRGSFYLRKATKSIFGLVGMRILVVDDVLTTGATLSECAAVLKSAGAKQVWGAVVAKH